MNEQQYLKYKKSYGKEVVEANCQWIDPANLVEFDQIARIKGDLQDNIDRYTGQFLNGIEQETPISVIPLDSTNGEQMYIVKDGVTRGRAKQNAQLSDPNQQVYISVFQHNILGFGAEEWEDFQDSSNDHLGAQPSTENDLIAAIQRRIVSGRLNRIVKDRNNNVALDPSDPNELAQYAEIGGKYFCEEIFSNAGRTWKFYSNRIIKALEGSVNFVARVVPHTDADTQKEYTDLGGTAYQAVGGRWNQTSGNEHVFRLRDNQRIAPNLYGSLVQHQINKPHVDFTVILDYDKVMTKHDKDIIADRKVAVASIIKAVEIINPTFKVFIKSAYQIQQDPKGFVTLWSSAQTSGKTPSSCGAPALSLVGDDE